MLLTFIVSLSVHVFMLQVLPLPFPDFEGVSLWARLLNTALVLFALIAVCRAVQPCLGGLSQATQCIIVLLVMTF